MYPRQIGEELTASAPELAAPFRNPGRSSVHVTTHPAPVDNYEIEQWMLARADSSSAVAAYFDYLRRMRARFGVISQVLGYWNEDASHSLGHDRWSVGWAGASLLSMAALLYVLRSYDVDGVVLECGVFKGSSTACLSLVCQELGYVLCAADSFAGLPTGEDHYSQGDFKGRLEEVRTNIEKLGAPRSVRYVTGIYAESLKEWNEPVALLWIDVDLQRSTLDVLERVYPSLANNSVIFSDGFVKGVDFDGDRVRWTGGEPAGFYHFYKDRDLAYKAKPGGSKGLALIVPRCGEHETILFDEERFAYLTKNLGLD